MLGNLLVEETFVSIPEALLDGVIGFAVVFLGISILIGVVYLVGFIMKKTEGREKPVQTTSESVAPVEVKDEEDENELVAVITAAISAVYEKEGRKCEFVVRKIKRL